MARAVLVGLGIDGASDRDRLADAAQGFAQLPSRCRSLGRVGAVEFVDDSLSTNVLPALVALRAFEDRAVALLVGGHDRGLDYAALARAVAARTAPTLVVTMPDNGPRIGAAVREAADGRVEVIDAASLDAAVDPAFALGPGGGRGAALAGRPELRAFRRLPRACQRLRHRGRPVRDARLSALSRRPPAPAPLAR